MKLLAVISALILTVSGRIFNDPAVQKYANSAEAYQSGIEQQQSGLYSNQLHHQANHEVANHRPEGEKTAKVLGFHAENDGHQYRYAYETENGIKAQEEGKIEKGTAAHGVFSYKGDDGHEYTISYVADENGFRPTGDHLPTPPPIPEEILKSLEKNAKDEAAGIFDDGKYHHHQEQGHHDHQQIKTGHSLDYNSAGNSGADFSYYHVQNEAQESHLGHQESSGHSSASSSYYAPSSQFEASSGHQASLGQANSGYGSSSGHQSSLGQAESGFGSSSGFEPVLGHQSSSGLEGSLGHQYMAHEAKMGYHGSSGNEAHFGYQAASSQTANLGHQYSVSSGSMGHQAGAGSGYSSGSYVYRAPSGFAPSSPHGGIAGHITGHSGLSYLPPSSHSGGYHSHQ